MSDYEFTAELWEHSADSPGSWHFVTLPVDLAAELREVAGPARGFGSIRVTVAIGSSTWQTSLFPDSGSGSFVLPVKRPVRRTEALEAGDRVLVSLRLGD